MAWLECYEENTKHDRYIDIHYVTRGWTEGTGDATETGDGATWNTYDGSNNWTTAGGDFNATATDQVDLTGVGLYSWTVTADVQNFMDGTPVNYGWILKDTDETKVQVYIKTFASRENTTYTKPYLAVTFTAPWDSYETSARTVIRDTFNSSYQTVYMKGTGFADISYLIAYYDANGVKIGSETNSASGGVLIGQRDLTIIDTAVPGTWHTLVQPSSGYTAFGTDSYATIVAAPDTYGLLANDSYTVDYTAIPEFPNILAGIAVAGSCAGIYYWMRKRRLAYVKA